MAARTILQVVVPLLLLLLPAGLRELLLSPTTPPPPPTTTGGEVLDLHPLVLVPGLTCSELEARLTDAYRPSVPRCGAMKGNQAWFGLWANCSDLPAHHYVDCFAEQMSLVYDPAANDYRNLPGVETRVRGFGSSRGFQRNPAHTTWCFEVLRRELESAGYRDGDTLFGAPYDLRHAPPVPGQASEVFSGYFLQLRSTSHRGRQRAEREQEGDPLRAQLRRRGGAGVRAEHAHGVARRVRQAPRPRRPGTVPAEAGTVDTLRKFVSGSELMYVPTVDPLALTLRAAHVEELRVLHHQLPVPGGVRFGDAPLVNYSAHDVEDLLVAIGFGAGVEPFRRRAVPKMMSYFQAPMVPTTCINGVGNDTPEQLVYWDGDFDAPPEIVYGDGDTTINLISMLAFDDKMRREPEQDKLYKSIKLHGADHGSIVTADWALKRVMQMQEILEANRI